MAGEFCQIIYIGSWCVMEPSRIEQCNRIMWDSKRQTSNTTTLFTVGYWRIIVKILEQQMELLFVNRKKLYSLFGELVSIME